MIPYFILSLNSCPKCNSSFAHSHLRCNCFSPFDIIHYPNLKDLDFYINSQYNKTLINFSIRHNSCYLNSTKTDIFQNASSIQDIINIYNKFNIFQ